MKKIVRLTESDLKSIIKKVIKESTNLQTTQKITALRSVAKGVGKTSSCWTKGMCPKMDAGKVYGKECEPCAGPLAGILIPTVGAIAGAIIGFKNRAEQQKRQKQELEWIKNNPDLEDRSFTYFKDGSIQATKEGFPQDVMVFQNNVWQKLDY